MIGFVIYRYNGQTTWTLNNRICKTGYTFIVNGDKIRDINTNPCTMFGKAWKYLFGNNLGDSKNEEVVGGGFAIHNGEYKYNSITFNTGYYTKDDFHDGIRAMGPYEAKATECILDNWRYNNQQNTHVKDMGFLIHVSGQSESPKMATVQHTS